MYSLLVIVIGAGSGSGLAFGVGSGVDRIPQSRRRPQILLQFYGDYYNHTAAA